MQNPVSNQFTSPSSHGSDEIKQNMQSCTHVWGFTNIFFAESESFIISQSYNSILLLVLLMTEGTVYKSPNTFTVYKTFLCFYVFCLFYELFVHNVYRWSYLKIWWCQQKFG